MAYEPAQCTLHPEVARAWSAYQDIIDYPARVSDFVTLYVYLSDADESMSPLHVVPKSFALGATKFPHRLTIADAEPSILYEREDGRSAALTYRVLTGPAGSTYLWHACTLHGTRPQRHSKPRVSLRYLIQKSSITRTAWIDHVNAQIEGQLSLAQTRVDLNADGEAILRRNLIDNT